MALETLLKALAISRKTKLINTDGSLNKDFKKSLTILKDFHSTLEFVYQLMK
jgi:hypothetical protein